MEAVKQMSSRTEQQPKIAATQAERDADLKLLKTNAGHPTANANSVCLRTLRMFILTLEALKEISKDDSSKIYFNGGQRLYH